MNTSASPLPSSPLRVVFAVPYDTRFARQRRVFDTHMRSVMFPRWRSQPRNTAAQFELLFVRMPDTVSGAFNIGAARNLAANFLLGGGAGGDRLLFVFCDADKMPAEPDDPVWNFAEVPPGCVRQYYGVSSTSAPAADAVAGHGIFAIHAPDFARVNGFPNFWSWGMEDAEFTRRAIEHGLLLDRTTSYIPPGDTRVLHLYRGHPEAHVTRTLSRLEMYRFVTWGARSDGAQNTSLIDSSFLDEERELVVRAFATGTEDSPPAFVLPRHRIDTLPLGKMLVSTASIPSSAFHGPSISQLKSASAPAPASAAVAGTYTYGGARNRLQSLFGR